MPGSVVAQHISKSFTAVQVLDDVSLVVAPGERVGVVGPNGIGKSTLLRILAGLDEPDTGSVVRGGTVGYLPQEPEARAGESVRDYLARRTGVGTAEQEMEAIAARLGSEPELAGAYSEALEQFLALGGEDFEARVGAVLTEVGLARRCAGEVASLWGGGAARPAPAAILLARFDVFLLDEPTNDLDFAGLDRLEGVLDSLPGGVVVVSHDRAFLDRGVDRILELQEETHRAVEYAGGWTDYVDARNLSRSQQYDAHDKYQAEKRALTERARSQRQWSEQGVAREKKNPKDNDKALRKRKADRTEKQASKVRATEQRLARLTPVDKPWEGWQLRLSLAPTARSGDVVARLDGAVVERGPFRLGPIDLEVAWQERLAILGPNGSGKTTLLRALLGTLPLTEGRRYLGPGVVVGEMDQRRDAFAGDSVVLDHFLAETGLTQSEGRSLLAKFGLGADHVGRAGSQLSPGERTRVILATLMAQGVNCLVLDEPTNH